jgi:hypothetical protein
MARLAGAGGGHFPMWPDDAKLPVSRMLGAAWRGAGPAGIEFASGLVSGPHGAADRVGDCCWLRNEPAKCLRLDNGRINAKDSRRIWPARHLRLGTSRLCKGDV